MITTKPLTLEAARRIFVHARNQDEFHDVQQLLEDIDSSEYGICFEVDGVPEGMIVARRNPHFPKMGHTWAVFTDKARGYGLSLVKTARRVIRENMEPLGFELLYTFCREHEAENMKWMRAIGFKRTEHGDHYDPDDGFNWKGFIYHE